MPLKFSDVFMGNQKRSVAWNVLIRNKKLFYLAIYEPKRKKIILREQYYLHPANIYVFKFNRKNNKKGVKYVQSWQ